MRSRNSLPGRRDRSENGVAVVELTPRQIDRRSKKAASIQSAIESGRVLHRGTKLRQFAGYVET